MSATGDIPTSHKWWATMINKSCKWGHSSYNSVHIPVINPNFVNKWPIFSGDWGHQPDYICPKTIMVVWKCSIWQHGKSKPLFPTENHLPRVSFHTPPVCGPSHAVLSGEWHGVWALTRKYRSMALPGTLLHEQSPEHLVAWWLVTCSKTATAKFRVK